MTFDPDKAIVSQAEIMGARPYQIDVEIREETMRMYGLTLKQVAEILRSENVDVPGGTLKSSVREVLLRSNNKRVLGAEIAELPLLTRPDGVVLTVGDVGDVKDGFSDIDSIDFVNGQPAQVIAIDRTANEDVLALCDAVHKYAEEKQQGIGYDPLPAGYRMEVFFDQSVHVRGRMDLLRRNGLQGLLLVFLVLAIFLELKLAFWVALGIPISVLGAGFILLYMGHTLNLLSLFAFLLALGIVVDDAIVIGENICTHREMEGADYPTAAVEGAYEVLPAVTASITTTIIAFTPLFFISGVMGKFFAVLPVAVVAMLAISLAESVFLLPCHLSHKRSFFFRLLGVVFYPIRFLKVWIDWTNVRTRAGLRFVVERFYLPVLRWGLDRPWVFVFSGTSLLIITVMTVQAGVTPFVLFPKVDSPVVGTKVVFPEGTPVELTDAATRKLAAAVLRAEKVSLMWNWWICRTVILPVNNWWQSGEKRRERFPAQNHSVLGLPRWALVDDRLNSNCLCHVATCRNSRLPVIFANGSLPTKLACLTSAMTCTWGNRNTSFPSRTARWPWGSPPSSWRIPSAAPITARK